MSKKTESYEIEVRKLKELLDTVTKSQAQSINNNSQSQNLNTQTTL